MEVRSRVFSKRVQAQQILEFLGVLKNLCQSDKIILRIDTDGRNRKKQFDFNDAVQQLLSGKNINGKDGILAPLVKQLVEAALETELDSHITQDVFSGNKNRKNGKTSKTIKSTSGTFELETPRDRAGSF